MGILPILISHLFVQLPVWGQGLYQFMYLFLCFRFKIKIGRGLINYDNFRTVWNVLLSYPTL